ncbi:MAG: hypothetical protein L6R38_005337 [Xanthoria sp. 2 TBL-2021]|nr:MAG: hypothetical protein L6R38_005337 [Xanthoria sp. 2 TBL-2021]
MGESKASLDSNGPAPENNDSPKRSDYGFHSFQDFTWHQFTGTMSTGSLAVVLFQTPYKFPGLVAAGKVIFIIDLIFFALLCICISLRFFIRPKLIVKSVYDSHQSHDEPFYLGAFGVSLALVLENISQYGVPACGPWLVRTCEILFWIYFACILVAAVLQYQTLFVTRNFNIDSMTPSWLLPIYPLLLTGSLASVLIQHQPHESASPMWICGVASQGLGWMVTILMYAMWAIRLLTEEIPAPAMRPSMFVAVGPTAYTITAIVSLGASASKGLPDPFLGDSPKAAAATIHVVAVVAGTFLWLFAFWFFALSTVAVVLGSKKLTPNYTWWSFIYPNAGLTLATIQMGKAYDSPAINYLCSVMTAALFLGWLFVSASLLNALRKGRLG